MHSTTITNDLSEPDRTSPSSSEVAGYVADFQGARPRLFGIAYRMLGRAADAEDIVQDVWLRWQGTDRTQVRDRIAFLVTITTRVTLNATGSARARHEILVDRWLPEDLPTSEDPSLTTERAADVEHAVLVVLQRLTPTERAVFVLREAFAYPFRDIGDRLGISETNARQLCHRARARLTGPRHEHEPVPRADQDRLLRAFLDAAQHGAMAHLERLLTADARGDSAPGRRRQQRNPSCGQSGRADEALPRPSQSPDAARSKLS
ncbi:sigma-70 family RNA polymerase sigma factor [Nocardia sp. CA-290969]|uniref:sigma-70 family RNA polymerase sigma factor n=1 Tax=Nocardia sp. CA-290969 TaxID=3239986 RepID=UPI003D91C519